MDENEILTVSIDQKEYLTTVPYESLTRELIDQMIEDAEKDSEEENMVKQFLD